MADSHIADQAAAGPVIHPTAFVHGAAVVIGRVTLGARVSVWPTAVLRGDSDTITVGAESNIQDGTIVHADAGVPTIIGARVSVGHRAIIHGAIVEDDCLIGMGAIVLNGSRIGAGSLVAAGALVTEGMQVPAGSLVLGLPGKVAGQTTAAMRERMARTVAAYLALQVKRL